jgi:A/G-specific adenine glycosylase
VFPSDYDSILALKGIGPYTAAAIASFAYNLPHAVLDGNVFRVLSRIFADDTPIDTTAGKKRFTHLAEEALAREEAGTYNQAIMDFGATVCKPVPDCASCFFSDHCEAFIQGKQQLLPVKEKKLKKRDRWLNYIVAYRGDEFLIRQRLEKDIWQQLFEFVLIETPSAVTEDELLTLFRRQYGVGEGAVKGFVHGTRQQLSHQQVTFTFLLLELGHKPPIEHHSWISRGKMETLAFPKTLKSFIQEHL